MATEVVKSAFIIAADTTPSGLPSAILNGGGKVYSVMAMLEAAGAELGSIYRLARVPTKARMYKIEMACDDLDSGDDGVTLHIGLYRTVADGAAEVDVDLFAASIDATAAIARTDYTFQAGTFTIDDIEKELWDAAGVSADPGGFYDICVTSAAQTNTGGTISLWATWVQ